MVQESPIGITGRYKQPLSIPKVGQNQMLRSGVHSYINHVMKAFKLSIYPAIFCLISVSTFAQNKPQQHYHLFKPVPKEMMRELETDLPDVTESPYTTDAGHFQYEADLLRMERERDDKTNQKKLLINQANLKLGLTGTTDIQVVLQSYGRQTVDDLNKGSRNTSKGVGELTLRIKQNILGTYGGNFAMAVIPYLRFPTSRIEDEPRHEYGMILPMQVKLPGDWTVGFQLEADRLKDKYQNSMHTELLQTLSISHEIIKGLDGIGETYYTYDFKQHQWANFLNAALKLEVSKDFLVHAGLNYGIQHDAEKNYFIGTSFRL